MGLNSGMWKDKREQMREWVTRVNGWSTGPDGCGAGVGRAAVSWMAAGFLSFFFSFLWDLSSPTRD